MIIYLLWTSLALAAPSDFCKMDSDCELKFEPKCKYVEAVPVKFLAKWKKWWKTNSPETCRVFEQPQLIERHEARCIEGECVAVYKP